MTIHFSILAWRVPRTEGLASDRPQSIESPRVEHNRSDLAHTHIDNDTIFFLSGPQWQLVPSLFHYYASKGDRPFPKCPVLFQKRCLSKTAASGPLHFQPVAFTSPVTKALIHQAFRPVLSISSLRVGYLLGEPQLIPSVFCHHWNLVTGASLTLSPLPCLPSGVGF